MCGIMFCEGRIDYELFSQSFNKIAHRGPDESRIIIDDYGSFGFHRLAIMDVSENGMQPFETSNLRLMCNGEIYNELSLKAEFAQYPYIGHSDCEVLLPLYEAYGKDMGSYLDAEFAFVLVDKVKGITLAGRDPIGIRPLFYGVLKDSHKMAFASEAKALLDLCDDIKPFPCGYIYYDGAFIQYHDITAVYDTPLKDIKVIQSKINTGLVEAVKKRMMSDVPIGYLLSGGLDSSLVCAIAAQYTKGPITTFAIGMAKDAIDLKYAKQVADYIGSTHHEVLISMQDVLDAIKDVVYHCESYDITTIRASLGMYLLTKYIKEKTSIKVVLSGEISDELFGYKYTDYAPSASAFQTESEKRLSELYMYDVLRADRCIAAWSLEARVPFGDLDFVKDVMSIDPSLKMNTNGVGKYLLRSSFLNSGLLPESILFREKAAFSDAVGHSMVDELKAMAEKLYTKQDLILAQAKYPHCPPFTKEALWYRDMFEAFYPSQSHWISAFWMPNASWAGCQVDDPSARVLQNYGQSGK